MKVENQGSLPSCCEALESVYFRERSCQVLRALRNGAKFFVEPLSGVGFLGVLSFFFLCLLSRGQNIPDKAYLFYALGMLAVGVWLMFVVVGLDRNLDDSGTSAGTKTVQQIWSLLRSFKQDGLADDKCSLRSVLKMAYRPSDSVSSNDGLTGREEVHLFQVLDLNLDSGFSAQAERRCELVRKTRVRYRTSYRDSSGIKGFRYTYETYVSSFESEDTYQTVVPAGVDVDLNTFPALENLRIGASPSFQTAPDGSTKISFLLKSTTREFSFEPVFTVLRWVGISGAGNKGSLEETSLDKGWHGVVERLDKADIPERAIEFVQNQLNTVWSPLIFWTVCVFVFVGAGLGSGERGLAFMNSLGLVDSGLVSGEMEHFRSLSGWMLWSISGAGWLLLYQRLRPDVFWLDWCTLVLACFALGLILIGASLGWVTIGILAAVVVFQVSRIAKSHQKKESTSE